MDLKGRATVEFAAALPGRGLGRARSGDLAERPWRRPAGAFASAGIGRAIAAIGITNQRETTLLWGPRHRAPHPPRHRLAGPPHRRPLRRPARRRARGPSASAPGSCSTRTSRAPRSRGSSTTSRARARARARRARLRHHRHLAGLKLTGGAVHVTDVTNASRTLLLNLESLAWDDDCSRSSTCRAPCCPRSWRAPSVVGVTRASPGCPTACPSRASRATSRRRSSARGASAGRREVHLRHRRLRADERRARARWRRHRLLTTVGVEDPGEVAYALEGSAFIAGAAVQWLRDGLGLITQDGVGDRGARAHGGRRGRGGVRAGARGLGAPHWAPRARGHRLRASGATRPRGTSRGRRSTASRWRSPTCSRPWRRTRARPSRRCGSTAARRPTTC
jgi:glycerol kinase